ncbi:hypothetical protein [Halomonas tibetensis]|uniref:Uncharacterized protein n=1 Tax=Halomonas tibetensis TaxID=2259590 RepID=A0ABV7B1Z0_9GAMM
MSEIDQEKRSCRWHLERYHPLLYSVSAVGNIKEKYVPNKEAEEDFDKT